MASDTFVQRLGRERLQVLSQLGEGAAGTVFRVRDRQTGGLLALKVLRDATPHAVLRFQREAALASSLQHEHVVRVQSTGVFEGRCFIAYELVEGARSLGDAFAGAPLARRVELLRDAARGLGHAHARGIVHRDVKPENVLVGEDDRARVTDFGLALTDDADRLTRTGAIVGTPYYMAPEQVAGKRAEATPATDVWALGVMLYEALTDERPFDGASLLDLASAISAAAPTPPSRICAVPGPLEDLCARALRADPAARPADGEAFARELDAWLEQGGATRSPWRRRALVALGAALVVAGGALVLLAVAPGPPRPADEGPASSTPRQDPAAAPAPAAPAEVPLAVPSWRRTLEEAVTYRILGRSRRGPDEPWGTLEWTVAHDAPRVDGARARIDARILRVRCRMSSFVEIDYDSDHPTLTPIDNFEDMVRAALAAPLRLEVDLDTGAVLEVQGLPLGDGRRDGFRTLDGRMASVSVALRPLAQWFSEPWARLFLQNGLTRLPAVGAGPSFTAPCAWSSTRWLDLPRRVRAAGDGRFEVLLDGPARVFDDEGAGAVEVRVANVRYEGAVELKGERIVRSSSTLEYDDQGAPTPTRSSSEFEFELLR